MDTPKKLTFFKDAPEYINPAEQSTHIINDQQLPPDTNDTPASDSITKDAPASDSITKDTPASEPPAETPASEPHAGIPASEPHADTPASEPPANPDTKLIPADELTQIPEAEQIEDNVMLYIKLIHPHDKHFIQYQYIYDNGEKYISYIKSAEYQKYLKDRKALEQRYSSNKKYIIEVTKRKVTVFKRDKEGNIDKPSPLDTLSRPSYINLQIHWQKHSSI